MIFAFVKVYARLSEEDCVGGSLPASQPSTHFPTPLPATPSDYLPHRRPAQPGHH